VARDLLGKTLVRQDVSVIITETEAYLGPQDLAAHARFGKTNRTAVLFGPAGRAYIYMIYGMYYCLNIVTEGGMGSGVLIRGSDKVTGPGRLCKYLNIDKTLNGLDVTQKGELHVVDKGVKILESQILITPRVGIDYAGAWKDKPLRYALI
jgi:DNA-3-methyladenine glycosylase